MSVTHERGLWPDEPAMTGDLDCILGDEIDRPDVVKGILGLRHDAPRHDAPDDAQGEAEPAAEKSRDCAP